MPDEQQQVWISEKSHKNNILSFDGSRLSVPGLPIESDAERNVLGIFMMLSQNDPQHPDLNRFIPWLESEDFYHIRNAYVHRAMLRIWQRKEAIALDTVASELSKHSKLQDAGGNEYLTALIVGVQNLQLETYANMVKRAAALRYIVACGAQMMQLDPAEDMTAVMLRVAQINRSVIQRAAALSPNAVSGEKVLDSGLQQIIYDLQNPDYRPGLKFGFEKLDANIVLKHGHLMTIAAPTGGGKSMLCLNFLMNAARLQPSGRFLYIATEDRESVLIERILSAESMIPADNITRRTLSSDQLKRLQETSDSIREALTRIEFSHMMMPTMQDIETRLLTSLNSGCDGAYLDWMHHSTIAHGMSNEIQATSAIFNKLRELKDSTDLPLVVTTQMNRKSSGRSDPRPNTGDLAYSSTIEQVSDVILFIYVPSMYDDNDDKEVCELICRKNRSSVGPFTLPMRYRYQYSKFQELS